MPYFLITATHNRSEILTSVAFPSLLRQSDQTFCWILVNDGCDLATRELAENLAHSPPSHRFEFIYCEMPHPATGEGFGLCHARNLGLSTALTHTGHSKEGWVSYLDDDNRIAPDFVACTKQFLEEHPAVQCSMVQQWRQRDVVSNGQVVRPGKAFISPSAGTRVEDLIQQRELFDSNGYTHRLENAPRWNPGYRVFADYAYLLQCLDCWGRDSFRLHPRILVDYRQTSEGIIGQSSYREWAAELQSLLDGNSSVLSPGDRPLLLGLIRRWQAKAPDNQTIPAFTHPGLENGVEGEENSWVLPNWFV
ncbi:glycosyltransferase family 2 protein [bacterium]|nr:glycosyltransferase family 2 protein [bacterium]